MKCSLLALAAVLSACASANLITNSSFEQPATAVPFLTIVAGSPTLTGWTVTGNSVEIGNQFFAPGFTARIGAQFVDLAGAPGPGKIEQAFTTVVAQKYIFGWSGTSNGPSSQMQVFLNGPLLFNITTAPQGNWVDYSWTFTATSTLASIGFQSSVIGNQGSIVDRVFVEPLPTLIGQLILQDTVAFAANRSIAYSIMQGTTVVTSGTVTATAPTTPISISLPSTATGPATLIFNGSSFLRKTTAITLSGLNVSVGTISCQNGDADLSGEVDAADIDAVIADFGSNAVNDNDVDVSGEVDSADIDIVVANFGGMDN